MGYPGRAARAPPGCCRVADSQFAPQTDSPPARRGAARGPDPLLPDWQYNPAAAVAGVAPARTGSVGARRVNTAASRRTREPSSPTDRGAGLTIGSNSAIITAA